MSETDLGIIGDPHGDITTVTEDVDYLLVTGDLGKPYLSEPLLDYYDRLDAPVYLVPGNHDIRDYGSREEFAAAVDEYDTVHNIDGETATVGEYDIAGYGAHRFYLGPETLDEWERSRGFTDAPVSYREQREQLADTLADTEQPTVLLSHNVPFDSGVDVLESEMAREANRYGLPWGSDVLSTVLADDVADSVVLNVGGHIHEGRGTGESSDVPVINAGQGDVTYVTLEDGAVDDITPV